MEERGDRRRDRGERLPSVLSPLQSPFAEILNFRWAGAAANKTRGRSVCRVIREGQEPFILHHVLTDKRESEIDR